VKRAKGDIVIFSDATTKYKKDAIRKIIRNYNDPSIGAVSGRYEYVNPTGLLLDLGAYSFGNTRTVLRADRLESRRSQAAVAVSTPSENLSTNLTQRDHQRFSRAAKNLREGISYCFRT